MSLRTCFQCAPEPIWRLLRPRIQPRSGRFRPPPAGTDDSRDVATNDSRRKFRRAAAARARGRPSPLRENRYFWGGGGGGGGGGGLVSLAGFGVSPLVKVSSCNSRVNGRSGGRSLLCMSTARNYFVGGGGGGEGGGGGLEVGDPGVCPFSNRSPLGRGGGDGVFSLAMIFGGAAAYLFGGPPGGGGALGGGGGGGGGGGLLPDGRSLSPS